MQRLIKSSTHYQFNLSRITVFLIFIFLCSAFSGSTAADSDDFPARFRKLSDELRCPTCQGLSVKDSEAGFSNSIKDKIRELMKDGKSDKEILAYFVERYGEWILRAPTKSGFNLVLWILPGAGILIGLFIVLFRSKRWVSQPQQEKLASLSPEEERKIKEDLGRFEEG
ncbi:MAG: cystathionine gamma-synthase [Deltaproteobacteria bacterium]|nr:cystathionine gamma-synthase [Deltaproteobacteria bacterium]